jgi:hypothetical protein
MTENRKRCFETFRVTGLKPILLQKKDLNDWVVRQHPLHRAFEYLSPVHQSDYLRSYFMYFHGGGYADIKEQTGSWLDTVDRLRRSRWFFGAGYREIRGGVVHLDRSRIGDRTYVLSHPVAPTVARAATTLMRSLRPFLIGNCAFYFKRGTNYAKYWLNEAERRLDLLLPELQRYPPAHPRDRRLSGSGYPVPWPFIMGEINAPLATIHAARLLRSLPRPIFENYQ